MTEVKDAPTEANVKPTDAPLRILAWPAVSTGNRYPQTLYSHMNATVDPFFPGWGTFASLFVRRYDIFHIHWLESPFWRTGQLAIVRAVLLTLLATIVVKLRGCRVVWTAHDPVPHQMKSNARLHHGAFGLLWRLYSALFLKMADGVTLLSETHRPVVLKRRPYLRGLPFTVIPHPHFKDVYPNTVGKRDAREALALGQDETVLLLLGNLRPYKNAEGLIEAFRGTTDPLLRLVIAGDPDGPAYIAELTALAGNDPRISFHFGFVADDRLQLFLNAADCVVIPFRNATNSGSVALALSFARPVAVPTIPVFRELSAIVGPEWMYLLEGELSASELGNIQAWIRSSRASEPPLDVLDWDHIGERTEQFFRSVIHPKRSQ
jgi:beta-1,4-mannosyltransferase